MMEKTDPRLADPALRALFDGADGAEKLLYWQEATAGQAAPDAAAERQLAQDILAHRSQHPAAILRGVRGAMLARAASALRAAAQAGGGSTGPGDGLLDVTGITHPFRGFFGVEVLELQHRRFDGAMSGPLRREVFVMVDAVTVLPYDPVRDLVLMVEQFRAGPVLRGGTNAWQIEAVAGRIDAGETPETAARREAVEEAGVELGALLPVAGFYPSPGAATEYIHSYVALAALDPARAGLHGLPEEGEDIRTLIEPFDAAMTRIAVGEIANAPLILTLLWLQRERPALRAAAGL